MKKNNLSVMDLVKKAIIDSINFSERDKSVIFISTSPHVYRVHFYAYRDGWSPGKEMCFDINLYTRGGLAPTVKEAKKILKPIYDLINEKANNIRRDSKQYPIKGRLPNFLCKYTLFKRVWKLL